MAAVGSREGVINMTDTDTHSPISSSLISAIIVDDDTGTGTITIRKFNAVSGPIIFSYTGGFAAPTTSWFGINEVVSSSGGLYCAATNATAYIYIR